MVDVEYSEVNAWSTGFQGQIIVTNDGATATADGWQITITSTGPITDIWGATIVSRNGDTYVIEAKSWNSTLAPGASANVGFIVRHGGDGGVITDVAPVGGDVDPPAPVVPDVSIGDAVVTEADGAATLTVTLSEPTTITTRVDFAAAAASADEADYTPVSGTLVFAPGETTATITVPIVNDTEAEPDEAFTVTLSAPDGLTIADGTGTVTIAESDQPAPPRQIAIEAAVSVAEDDPAPGAAVGGWLSTSGSDIVDEAGNVVRITGVNWFGAETDISVPHGLWARNYQDMMDQMLATGFNTLRLPFANAMLDPGATVGGINFSLNPDLAGLSPIEVLDAVIACAGEIGLRVILDNHRNGEGGGPNGNGLWYGEAGVTQQSWQDDWEFLADRYKDDPTVVGFDLINEPHNATWGTGDVATDFKIAAENAANAIHAINPNVLIIVEGTGDGYWWGGDLRGIADNPLEINEANKVIYSPHAYPNSIYSQSWFSDPNYPDNLEDIWDYFFGYIAEDDIAPIMVGEFGSRLQDPLDVQWMDEFIPYLTENELSYTYWSWNPNSTDTGGILADDWTTVIDAKVDLLEPSLGAPLTGGDGEAVDTLTPVTVTVSLSGATDEAVTVVWATADGTAEAGSDYEAASGTVTFAPGETTAEITVNVIADLEDEGDETFAIQLSSPDGGILVADEAIITITDDDDGDGGDSGGDGGGSDPQEPPANAADTNGDGIYSDLTVRQTWSGGFVADAFVINDSAGAVNGWQVELTTTASIRDIWNAEIVSHVGNVYTIGNVATNATIASDAERGWGFVADGLAAGLSISDVDVIGA
ncbi:chitinase, cellulase [Stappia sp. 22II-S9-Z10]|nr:chitinase, cellulase [Stappia sp. 22II-S9-Z10]